MAKKTEKVKPCPFCGNSVRVYWSTCTEAYYAVHKEADKARACACMLCGPNMIIGQPASLEDAVAIWNRRAK